MRHTLLPTLTLFSPREELLFTDLKQRVLQRLNDEFLHLLQRLAHHHAPALHYAVMTLHDLHVLARRLPTHRREVLEQAALGLGLTALTLHPFILRLDWRTCRRLARGRPLHCSPFDVALFFAAQQHGARRARKLITAFERWHAERGLATFLHQPLSALLRHRRTMTTRLLREHACADRVVRLVSDALAHDPRAALLTLAADFATFAQAYALDAPLRMRALALLSTQRLAFQDLVPRLIPSGLAATLFEPRDALRVLAGEPDAGELGAELRAGLIAALVSSREFADLERLFFHSPEDYLAAFDDERGSHTQTV